MSTENTKILHLLRAWSHGSITPAEEQELASLLDNNTFDNSLQVHLQELIDQYRSTEMFPAINWEETYENIQGKKLQTEQHHEKPAIELYPTRRAKKVFISSFWRAAAIVLLIVTGTVVYWQSMHTKNETTNEVVAIPDILPGQEGAILTLANGKQIVLDSLKNGVITEEEGAKIQIAEGVLVYEPGHTTGDQVLYNKMTTPKGRQYKLALPDGTRIWLNAESSIEYPTVFSGKFRDVKVSGEVYFEIAPMSIKPFRVQVGDAATIDVLGTSFNLNAYENEDKIAATLITGAIKFTPSDKAGYILKPGEQVQLSTIPAQQLRVSKEVDLAHVAAWKNGVFSIEGLQLKDILKQLERWYDFNVVYKTKPSEKRYRGGMDRNVKFSEILEVLKEMRVNYDWDGKTLTIK